MELFIKTDLDLGALATRFREVFNLRERNRSAYQADQDRDGANYGGPYYLFEVLGLELYLLRNAGEAEIPDHSAYPFYLYVEGRPGSDDGSWRSLMLHLRDVLRDAGLEAEVSPCVPGALAGPDG